MTMYYVKSFALALLSVLFLSCNAQSTTPDQLRGLAKDSATVIIDVRTVEEFAEGHIPNSINIPLQILDDSVESIKKYENIILICRSGNRSSKAKALLEEKYGFKNLYNGGGWKSLEEIIAREPEK